MLVTDISDRYWWQMLVTNVGDWCWEFFKVNNKKLSSWVTVSLWLRPLSWYRQNFDEMFSIWLRPLWAKIGHVGNIFFQKRQFWVQSNSFWPYTRGFNFWSSEVCEGASHVKHMHADSLLIQFEPIKVDQKWIFDYFESGSKVGLRKVESRDHLFRR